jgi:hypothetical protein
VNNYQGMVMNATGWFLVLLDGWAMHTHWVAVLGFVFLIYSMWSICMDTGKEEGAQGWRKRQIADGKTCQVCRQNPAEVKGANSRGAPQWRCQTCHDLKNRAGFTKGKQ